MFSKQILAILALTPASMGTRLAQTTDEWDSPEEFFNAYTNSIDGLAQTRAESKSEAPRAEADPLPTLFANADQITVSGFSSGAHNSCHQMIVMSNTIKGAGCAKGGAFMWGYSEFSEESTTVESIKERSIPIIHDLNDEEKIDPISNFTDEKRAVILLSASDDRSVPAKNVEGIFEIYSELGLNGSDDTEGQNLKLIDTGDSGHTFLEDYPETILSFLYGVLEYTPIVPATSSTSDDSEGVLGTYSEFSQREFFPDDIDWENDENFRNRINGWIYTPKACEGEGSVNCRVHLAFHGCGGNAEALGKTGYNDLAAANNIIMVYPDTRCWDNEGDIDPDGFNTNTGFIPTVIKNIIDRVTGDASSSGGDSSEDDERPPRPEGDDRPRRPRRPDEERPPRMESNGLAQIEVSEAVMAKLFADFAQIQDPTSVDDMLAMAQTEYYSWNRRNSYTRRNWYTNEDGSIHCSAGSDGIYRCEETDLAQTEWYSTRRNWYTNEDGSVHC